MTTVLVSLSPYLDKFMNTMIKDGRAKNKLDVIKKALVHLVENEAVDTVLRAERELAQDLGMQGDLRELAKKI